LRLFSFGGYGLALAALALVVFGAIECPLAHLAFGGYVLALAALALAVFWRYRMHPAPPTDDRAGRPIECRICVPAPGTRRTVTSEPISSPC